MSPDLHFVGFNLSLDTCAATGSGDSAEARATIPADQLGWFFVLQEVVGEPRFGLDENVRRAARSATGTISPGRTSLAGKPVIDSRGRSSRVGGTHTGGLDWHSNAADLAAILYQKPVMIAVHGREMLDRNAFPESVDADRQRQVRRSAQPARKRKAGSAPLQRWSTRWPLSWTARTRILGDQREDTEEIRRSSGASPEQATL